MRTAARVPRINGGRGPEDVLPETMGASPCYQGIYPFPTPPNRGTMPAFDEKKPWGREEESRSGVSFPPGISNEAPDAASRVPARDNHGFRVLHDGWLPPGREKPNRPSPHLHLDLNPPRGGFPRENHGRVQQDTERHPPLIRGLEKSPIPITRRKSPYRRQTIPPGGGNPETGSNSRYAPLSCSCPCPSRSR